MPILNGKLIPDGILANAATVAGASPNSVNTGRVYDELQVNVAVAGATGSTSVQLQNRPEQFMGPAGPVRPGDVGWVNVADTNNPFAGMSLTAAAPSGMFRVVQPKGEYQVVVSGTLAATSWSAGYALSGETR